jgi:hypothetical protein
LEGQPDLDLLQRTRLSNNGIEGNSFDSLVLTSNSVVSDDAFNRLRQCALEERRGWRRRGHSWGTIDGFAAWGRTTLPNWLDERISSSATTYYYGDHGRRVSLDFVSYDDGFPATPAAPRVA